LCSAGAVRVGGVNGRLKRCGAAGGAALQSLSPQELSCHREQEAGPRSLCHYYPAVCQELADLTGRVNRDGTATIWAITSTVSGSGQGADPNKMVMITDNLAATSLPAGETFTTLRTARFAEVLRGVSVTPVTGVPPDHDDEGDRDR
jgi:hypothetical protein